MPSRSIAPFVVGLALAFASPASAQPDTRRDAARAFAEGTKAFDAGDFIHAAKTFEAAYQLAPHADALWNAARAWHMAGERARAANAYARFLREAPPNAADRAAATAALKSLALKLGRLDINVGANVTDARLDDTAVATGSVYVVPGKHVLQATSPRGPIEQHQVVKEGETTSVVLAMPVEGTAPSPSSAPASPPSAALPSTRDPSLAVTAPASRGWSPAVVWIGGGVTLVVAGLATWSGVDTLDALDAWEAAPTQTGLDAGRSKQLRTNLLLGGAIGAALFTGVAALWLVDWRKNDSRVGFGIGPGGIAASGNF